MDGWMDRTTTTTTTTNITRHVGKVNFFEKCTYFINLQFISQDLKFNRIQKENTLSLFRRCSWSAVRSPAEEFIITEQSLAVCVLLKLMNEAL